MSKRGKEFCFIFFILILITMRPTLFNKINEAENAYENAIEAKVHGNHDECETETEDAYENAANAAMQKYMEDLAEIEAEPYKNAIEQGYTAYFNGNEIDINKVDIDHYDVTIDNSKKEIYLSDRNPSVSEHITVKE